jgi:RNA polymerase sigma-70 factor (ECF subfamily)
MAIDDDQLVASCLAGDADALRGLESMLREHLPRVRRMGLSGAALDDLVADVRARLVIGDGERPPALRQFDGRGSLAGYLRAMIVRLAIDRLRAERSVASFHDSDGDEVDQIAAFAISLEARLTKQAHTDVVKAAFRRAWEELPPHQRLLLSQQVIDALSIDEIGALHGIHRATAARRCVAAREALLARLRGTLRESLGVDTDTAESILFNVASRLSGILETNVAHDP